MTTEQKQEQERARRERESSRTDTRERSSDEDQALFGDDELTASAGAGKRSSRDSSTSRERRSSRQTSSSRTSSGRITASFSEARSKPREPVVQGEEASTEDLRVALMRYRAFFNRLLKT